MWGGSSFSLKKKLFALIGVLGIIPVLGAASRGRPPGGGVGPIPTTLNSHHPVNRRSRQDTHA
jgi:hypothetical protein